MHFCAEQRQLKLIFSINHLDGLRLITLTILIGFKHFSLLELYLISQTFFLHFLGLCNFTGFRCVSKARKTCFGSGLTSCGSRIH